MILNDGMLFVEKRTQIREDQARISSHPRVRSKRKDGAGFTYCKVSWAICFRSATADLGWRKSWAIVPVESDSWYVGFH